MNKMEQVGDVDNITNVDVPDTAVHKFKDGGNSDGDDHTDIAMIHEQGEDAKKIT